MKNLLGTIGMCFAICAMYASAIPVWLGVIVLTMSSWCLLSTDIYISWLEHDVKVIIGFLKGGRNE